MDEELINEEGTEEEGDPVDTGDASDSPPADETEVPDVGDDGERPDVDWDVDPADGEAVEQQVFTSQPVPPYSLGDLWDMGTSERLVCTTAKTALEAFDPDDWQPEETPEEPPQTVTRTVTLKENISDFSQESIDAYRAMGARAYAIYDDGTRVQVSWDDVSEPVLPLPDVIENEALILAESTNQHFWHRATDPDNDGAGTGAFVTDEEQDTFLEAMAQDVQPTGSRPLHNLLMNAEGIALRAAKRFRATFTPSGVAFFDGLGNLAANIVARFGKDGFLVGKETKSHLVGDYHSLQLRDMDGATYFHVSDLRGEDGKADVVAEFAGDGSTRRFPLPMPATDGDYTVTVSDSSGGSINSKTYQYFEFTQAPTDGAKITAEFATRDSKAKAYTVGVRGSGSVGAMSYAEGSGCVASGNFSHAEGFGTVASDMVSHAEGQGSKATMSDSHAEGLRTTASGNASHAEGGSTTASGSSSHAEGSRTTASGSSSHAEGRNTTASGPFSHAEGRGTAAGGICSHAGGFYTTASRDFQTVIGSYNIADTTSALIIGNGNSESTRSNALAVDWNGNVTCGKVNGVDVTAISPSGNYLPLSGGTLTGNLSFGSTGKNINMVDGSGFSYPALRDNGSNLWIGASSTAAQHHSGRTYISSGHDGTDGYPTIYISVPNAANDNATNYGVYHTGNKPDLTALPGILGINHGGTGSDGVDTVTTVSSIISAASGTTISAARYSVWGKFACLSVTFTRSAAWAAHAQVQVGTVVSGKRPTTQVGGGSAGATAGLATGGAIYARNTTGASITAGTATTIGFTYLLP